MRYVAHITRDKENVGTEIIEAESDEIAYKQARRWAASLNLAFDDEVWLVVRDQNGAFKPFSREDF